MQYDPFSHALQDDPFPVYAWLRDDAPVYHNEELGFWALSRFEDVLQAHLDVATFTSTHGVTIEGLDAGMDTLLSKDPPHHTGHRRVLSRVFAPKRVAALEPQIRQVARRLLDAVQEKGQLDVVSDFSARLPLEVVSDLLGIPVDLREMVHDLSNRMLSRDESYESSELHPDALTATFEYLEMWIEFLAYRRLNPADDIFDILIRTPVVDDQGNEMFLTDDQLASRFIELAVAGHETVMKLIASGIVALSGHPDQRDELMAHPEQMGNAVEEMARWAPPSHYQGRWSAREATLQDVTIPAGQRIILVTAAATHDPREYTEPELFDSRRSISRQLGFGFGPHLCLGAPLARLETRVALEELLRHCPRYEIDTSGVERAYGTNVQGLKHLPITFTSARSGVRP